MTVSVNVETGRRDKAIVVPNEALTAMDGNRAELWLIVDGRATKRPVQLGLRGLTQTEVTSGLHVGDWILSDARASVAPGDRVRVVPGPSGSSGNTAARNELPAKMD